MSNNQYLGRTAILGTTLRTAEVDVPEWGGKVRIQEPSAATAALISNMAPDTPLEHKTAWWIVMCVIDGKGNRLFTGDDIPALVEKSSSVISYLAGEIIDQFAMSAKKARLEAKKEIASE